MGGLVFLVTELVKARARLLAFWRRSAFKRPGIVQRNEFSSCRKDKSINRIAPSNGIFRKLLILNQLKRPTDIKYLCFSLFINLRINWQLCWYPLGQKNPSLCSTKIAVLFHKDHNALGKRITAALRSSKLGARFLTAVYCMLVGS